MSTLIGPPPAPGDPAKPEQANPFKGLAYFSPEDKVRFGGRDRDIQLVTNGILKSRTFVLYSRSGLGKTSLLLAGIFPDLEVHGCAPVLVRTLENPLEDLNGALMAAAGTSEPADNASLVERISSNNDGAMVVIAFDQFEEFFVRFSEESASSGEDEGDQRGRKEKRRELKAIKQRFIEEAGRLANDPELNMRLVWCLREDWVAEMLGFEHAIPDIMDEAHRLLPLTAFGVRHSVLSLVDAAGVTVDSGMLSELINTLSDYDFDPAVLQVICSEVWKQACDDGSPDHLKQRHFDAIGGVTGVFNKYLDTVTQAISDKGRRTRIQVRAVLNALITEKRTKRALKFGELLDKGFAIKAAELEGILDMLCDNQLVRHDIRGGEAWYELIHERLVELILDWLGDDKDYFDFRAARNLVKNACSNPGWDREPELLASGAHLEKIIGPFKKLLRFSDAEKRFLLCSAIYADAPDVRFWVRLATPAVAVSQYEEFLGREDHAQLRRQAGRSVRRARLAPAHFAGKCLELALNDESEEVSQACAESFARLARPEDTGDLKPTLKNKLTRKRAIAVVAAMYEAGTIHNARGVGRWSISRAKKLILKRGLKIHRDGCTQRNRQGALGGVIAAVIWSVTAGLLGTYVFMREIAPPMLMEHPVRWVLTIVGAYLVAGLVAGPLFGWAVARRATRNAVLSKHDGAAFKAVFGPKLAGFLALALIVQILLPESVASMLLGDNEAKALGIMFTTGALLLLLLAAASAALAQTSLRANDKPRRWLRAWPWAFGASLILPLFAWANFHLIDDLDPGSNGNPVLFYGFWSTLIFLFGSALAGGLLIYTSLNSLARSSPGWNRTLSDEFKLGKRLSTPKPPNLAWRSMGVLLTAAVLVILVRTNGIDALLDKPVVLDAGAVELSPEFRFSERRMDHAHYSLKVKPILQGNGTGVSRNADRPRLLEVRYDSGLRTYHQPKWHGGSKSLVVDGGQRFFAVTQGLHHIAFRRYGSSRTNPNFTFSAHPDILPHLPGGQGRLEAGDGHRFVIPVTRNADAELTGRFERGFNDSTGHPVLDFSISNVLHDNMQCERGVYLLTVSGPAAGDAGKIPVFCDSGAKELQLDTALLRRTNPGEPLSFEVKLEPHAAYERSHDLDHGSVVTTASFYPLSDLDDLGARIKERQRRGLSSYMDSATATSGGTRTEVVLTGAEDGRVRVWIDRTLLNLGQHGAGANHAAFSPDGQTVVTGHSDGVVRFWDFANLIRQYETWGGFVSSRGYESRYLNPLSLEGEVWGIAFNVAGDMLAVTTGSGEVHLLRFGERPFGEIPVERVFRRSVEHIYAPIMVDETGAAYKPSFSEDGQLLAVAASNGVHLLEVSTGKLLRSLDFKTAPEPGSEAEPAASYVAAFSPDGSQLMAGFDRYLLVWKTGLWNEPPQRLEHQSNLWFAAYHPDGNTIASACEDGTLHFWKLDRDGESQSFRRDEIVHRHSDRQVPNQSVWGLSFSPRGEKLVSASQVGTAAIWEFSDPVAYRDQELYLFLRAEPDGTKPLAD